MTVTEQDYKEAIKQKESAQEIIKVYHDQKREAFSQRLKDNPVFKDEELVYSATSLCPCGHGLAYPKDCGPGYHWDCSAILKGIADSEVQHTGQLPFMFYSV